MARFIEIEGNPVPPGAEAVDFETSDGAKLRLAYIPAENARATVIVGPGWSEFIEKYFEVAEDLVARNYNVAIIDWRGQGLSDDPDTWRGYFDRVAKDLQEIRDSAVAARFPGPYILLTHSMAGLPALLLLGRGDEGFARAVLCAPMTRLFPATQNMVIGAAAKTASTLGLANSPVSRKPDDSENFDGNMFTRDQRRHERFRLLKEAEPAAVRTGPTYGWVDDATRASGVIHKAGFFDTLKTPIRFISAGDERRIDGPDHDAIAARSPLIDHVTIKNALHEIMMEEDAYRGEFWEKVEAFLMPALAG